MLQAITTAEGREDPVIRVAHACLPQSSKNDTRFFRDAMSRLRNEAKELEAKGQEAAATIATLHKDMAKVRRGSDRHAYRQWACGRVLGRQPGLDAATACCGVCR